MRDERDHLDVALASAASRAQRLPSLPWPGEAEPEDEALLRYLDRAVSGPEREALRQRLHQSAFCRERLETLREALAEWDAAPEGVTAPERSLRISFLWARDGLRFLFGSLTPRSLVAVPVPTRGSVPDGAEELAFFDFAHRFGDVDVEIQVERVPGDRFDLQLQFRGERARLGQLRVSLSDRQGALLDSQPVEGGVARFSALLPASHRIAITAAKQELGHLVLDVLPG